MRNKLLALLATVVVALGLSLAPATPASASPTGCTSAWSSWLTGGVNWGQFRYCTAYDSGTNFNWWLFQVQDTLTDGFAVHLDSCNDAYDGFHCSADPQIWGHIITPVPLPPPTGGCYQSVGSVVQSNWPGMHQHVPVGTFGSRISVRLIRGHCDPSEQNVGSVEFFLSS